MLKIQIYGRECDWTGDQLDWKIRKLDEKMLVDILDFILRNNFYFFFSFFFKNMQKNYHFEIPDELESS
jgi:hypothetical protein